MTEQPDILAHGACTNACVRVDDEVQRAARLGACCSVVSQNVTERVEDSSGIASTSSLLLLRNVRWTPVTPYDLCSSWGISIHGGTLDLLCTVGEKTLGK